MSIFQEIKPLLQGINPALCRLAEKALLSDSPEVIMGLMDSNDGIGYIYKQRTLLHRLGWLEQFLVPSFILNNININTDDPYPQLEELFDLCDREALMAAGDKPPAEFQHRGQGFTLHRGVYALNGKTEYGYSWSSTVEVAQWFANWDDQNGVIVSGRFCIDDVLFYTNERNESEFVIDINLFDEGRIEFWENVA